MKVSLGLAMVFMIVASGAARTVLGQTQANFRGDWVGTAQTAYKGEIEIMQIISGNAAGQYFTEGSRWRAVSPQDGGHPGAENHGRRPAQHRRRADGDAGLQPVRADGQKARPRVDTPR